MNTTLRSLRHSLLLSAIAILILTAVNANAQSTDETRPTTIVSFPITGNLGSGTYYYQMPASLVLPGTGNAVLELTPPAGGGSMTVTFSGPTCCPPDAYIGVSTGLADPMREAARFNIPRTQPLLITIYISAGAKQTVRFRLAFHIAKSGDGGIVVTPPTPTPTPTPRPSLTPATPTDGICTDLSLLSGFDVREVGSTTYIKGYITNLSDTAYSGTARGQGLLVTVYRVGEAPRSLPIMRFTEVSARGFLPYSIRDTSRGRRPPTYDARIVYSPLNVSDRLKKNDDCNPTNDYSRGLPDDVLLPLEKLPALKP